MMNRLHKLSQFRVQQGVVLITVLAVIAMVVFMASKVLMDRGSMVLRTANIIDSDQAMLYSLGAEEFAAMKIRDAIEEDNSNTVHLGQAWAGEGFSFPVENGNISVKVEDMTSCFNVNSILSQASNQKNNDNNDTREPESDSRERPGSRDIRNPDNKNEETTTAQTGEQIFIRLLDEVVNEQQINSKELAAALRDWIDEDTTVQGLEGAEDFYYSEGREVDGAVWIGGEGGEIQINRTPPYRTANSLMASVTELRLIKGFDKIVYEKVLPYVCVLPDDKQTSINVNTLDESKALLLRAYFKDLTDSQATQIIANRPEKGYTQASFSQELANAGVQDSSGSQNIAFDSQYFKVVSHATLGRNQAKIVSVLQRTDKGRFKTLSRHFGEY